MIILEMIYEGDVRLIVSNSGITAGKDKETIRTGKPLE